MKKSLLFLVITFASFLRINASCMQNKYFILDNHTKSYQLSMIKLRDGSKQIELYNLLYEKSNLILFSILPIYNTTLWKEVTISNIKDKTIDFESLKSILTNGFEVYKKSNFYDCNTIKREDIVLVLYKNGKYYASNYCFLEYFNIINQQLVFPNLMGNVFINVKSPTLSAKVFEEKYYKAYGSFSPNSIAERSSTGTTTLLRPLEKPLLFHSGEIDIFNYKGHKFWQFTDCHINDDINAYRGIDRFLFVPNIGIIGGSFDAFFKERNRETLQEEYLEEKLILPQKITDIKIVN